MCGARLRKAIAGAIGQLNKSAGDLIENAVVANVRYQVKKLERSDLLMQLVRESKLQIIGGRYDLDTEGVAIVT
jgi:carbonic anhydrase